MSFSSLGLNDSIVKALVELNYETPTAIQSAAIPAILNGRNVVAMAETGTGKTAGFVLPLLEHLHANPVVRGKRIRALILVPTRELALQVYENVCLYSKHLDLSAMAMFGGVDSEPQKQQLTTGVDIVVATPGRLLDMLHQRALYLDELRVVVLDEADRMLDMGFIDAIDNIMERMPATAQRLLFSATIPQRVRSLIRDSIDNAFEINTSKSEASKPAIDQWLVTVDKDTKSALLSHMVQEFQWNQALIFIRTKHGAAKLVEQLAKRGIEAESFHSGRSQPVRTQLMADFKSGKVRFLVATGIAARGIDIDELTRVVNYDLPDENDDYIHRIGRTGRAGAIGEAISLVSMDDFRRLCSIEGKLGHLIIRKEIEGFAPKKIVPVSILSYPPKSRSDKPRSTKSDSIKNDIGRKSAARPGTRSAGKPDARLKSKPNNKSNSQPNRAQRRAAKFGA